MEGISDWLIAFVQEQDNALGLGVLAAAAALEYIFPPFPGDTVTLFGAVLITAYAWSFPAVFLAVMAGSVGGAMAAYAFGLRLRRRHAVNGTRPREKLDRLVDRFQRHGPLYLVINRFLPGIRTFFFVAAGLADMRPTTVLFYSALSAALWNLLLIALGAALGVNFDELLFWVRRYTAAVWAILGGIVAVALVRALWRRHRSRRDA